MSALLRWWRALWWPHPRHRELPLQLLAEARTLQDVERALRAHDREPWQRPGGPA